MATVVIVGDGPGGLSAALFLAKNDQNVTVFGNDETAMHFAHLHNYLGIPDISGTEFQERAREQVLAMGATLDPRRVTDIERSEMGFEVEIEDGETMEAGFVILTEGKDPALARGMGLTEPIQVDRHGRTAIEGLYVVGRSARPHRSQAIISAGDGASAALDILSSEAGKDVHDWDTPPKD